MAARVARECPVCHEEYQADPGRLAHGRQTTCSRACSYALRGRKSGDARRGKPSPLRGRPRGAEPWRREPPVLRPCATCGVTMELSPWQARRRGTGQRFCSKACAYEGRELKGTFPPGEAHPSYVDGKAGTGYPPEFNSALKRRIRERDGHYCQLCGMTEQEHLEKWRQVLTVNHIDFDKTNCADDNLNTLCTRCNTQINFDRERWTAYFQEAMLCG